jgi:hypothetical protein
MQFINSIADELLGLISGTHIHLKQFAKIAMTQKTKAKV